jgi:uncharacterized protein YjdB
MKKLFQIVILMVVSLGLGACDHDDNAVWHIWRLDISIEQGSDHLTVGQTAQLKALITPTFANVTDVTWWTNNEDVATVSAEGLVTAVGAGEATISVRSDYDQDINASIKITVSYEIEPMDLDDENPIDQSMAQSRKK